MAKKIKINYVTSSSFKIEENKIFINECSFADGVKIKDLFEFEYRKVSISELLEVDLKVMVMAEVTKAYSQIKVPCIVEHAGLIFEEFITACYPGGLTKPMWNALGDKFITATNSAGRKAIARAVVAYCDGMAVHSFVGETEGVLADKPRGGREFYWDTVFIPNDVTNTSKNMTYAEIVEEASLGLKYKIVNLSQSTKAMLKYLEYMRNAPTSQLWR